MIGRLKRGDYVRVRFSNNCEWTKAFVALASDTDPSSVALMFDGAVRASSGIVCNVLPLTVDYQEETVISLLGDLYEIEVQA